MKSTKRQISPEEDLFIRLGESLAWNKKTGAYEPIDRTHYQNLIEELMLQCGMIEYMERNPKGPKKPENQNGFWDLMADDECDEAKQ